jgi:hypothetical protein
MPNEPEGQQEIAEETQQSPMPSEEQTPEESEGLPENSSERTREQFEKLKKNNEELAEKVRQLENRPQEESVLSSLKLSQDVDLPKVNFPDLSKQQVSSVVDKLVDENGYLDESLLKNSLKTLQDEVAQAREEARRTREDFERREENAQVKIAHNKYPQLDPKSSVFDPKFFNRVKEKMIVQIVNGQKDFVAAADAVAEDYPLKKPDSSQTEKKEEQVRQINALGSSASRGSAPKTSSNDEEDLIRRTRAGDRTALMERLQKAGL